MWDDHRLLNQVASALFALAALVVLYGAVMLVIRMPAFAIREVHVSGDIHHTTREQVTSIADELRGTFFTVDLERVIEIALSNAVRFCRQPLQRAGYHAQAKPQRDHRDQRQDNDHQRQRCGDVQRQLLRTLGRDSQHDRPWTPENRVVIPQLARPIGGSVIVEERLATALPIVHFERLRFI